MNILCNTKTTLKAAIIFYEDVTKTDRRKAEIELILTQMIKFALVFIRLFWNTTALLVVTAGG